MDRLTETLMADYHQQHRIAIECAKLAARSMNQAIGSGGGFKESEQFMQVAAGIWVVQQDWEEFGLPVPAMDEDETRLHDRIMHYFNLFEDDFKQERNDVIQDLEAACFFL